MWKSTGVCHKTLEIEKKIITMVFELMVSLCIDICFNFFTFTMRHSIQEWTK